MAGGSTATFARYGGGWKNYKESSGSNRDPACLEQPSVLASRFSTESGKRMKKTLVVVKGEMKS